jgi:hypothetical protein
MSESCIASNRAHATGKPMTVYAMAFQAVCLATAGYTEHIPANQSQITGLVKRSNWRCGGCGCSLQFLDRGRYWHLHNSGAMCALTHRSSRLSLRSACSEISSCISGYKTMGERPPCYPHVSVRYRDAGIQNRLVQMWDGVIKREFMHRNVGVVASCTPFSASNHIQYASPCKHGASLS